MGQRGPVPKRESQRRRRNKESKAEKAKAPAVRVAAPEASDEWHPSAKRWYESLAESGQAQFFEPSDWEAARLVAHELSRYLNSPKRSAMMFQYLWSAMTDLLTTEGARRRLKIEIEREPPESEEDQEAAEVAKLDEYRRRAAS